MNEDIYAQLLAMSARETCKRMGTRPGGLPVLAINQPAVSKVDAKAREIGRIVRANGRMSKPNIMAAANLTPTTINNALSRAKEMGLIHYAGRVADVYMAGIKAKQGETA